MDRLEKGNRISGPARAHPGTAAIRSGRPGTSARPFSRVQRSVHCSNEAAWHFVAGRKTGGGKSYQHGQSGTGGNVGRATPGTGTEGRAASGTNRFHAARAATSLGKTSS